MKKRWIALLCLAGIAVSLLSGCQETPAAEEGAPELTAEQKGATEITAQMYVVK